MCVGLKSMEPFSPWLKYWFDAFIDSEGLSEGSVTACNPKMKLTSYFSFPCRIMVDL
jgi:hypothetical protein